MSTSGKAEEYSFVNGTAQSWICNFCQKTYKGGPVRIRSHLAGIKGQGIASCVSDGKAFEAARQRCKELQAEIDCNAATREAKRQRTESRGLVPAPSVASTASGSASALAGALPSCFARNQKGDTDQAVAEFCYATGIPFNVMRSPHANKMFAQVARHGPGYKAPGVLQTCSRRGSCSQWPLLQRN